MRNKKGRQSGNNGAQKKMATLHETGQLWARHSYMLAMICLFAIVPLQSPYLGFKRGEKVRYE
jgi:hypothetical protein